MFPEVYTSLDANQIVNKAKEYINMPEKDLSTQKEKNKKNILNNHCYVNRVKTLINL